MPTVTVDPIRDTVDPVDPVDPAEPIDPVDPRERSSAGGRRLVIVVRADPVICGHSGEARNLAEVALTRGFDDVRIVTWPIETLQAAGLPLKPLDTILPYSDGITVERPGGVGDYKVPDGRFTSGMVGRLVELFSDGVPTVCLSLYLLPHAMVVQEALAVCERAGLAHDVITIAEAVGSDITNAVRTSVDERRFGAAAHLFTTYLAHDHCVAVSEFTRDLIVESALQVDAACGTSFADRCAERIRISYPAIDTSAYLDLDAGAIERAMARRGLVRDGYALFLSRITPAKGVDDLVAGYRASAARHAIRLVIAGTGPALPEMRALVGDDDRIVFFDDVDDAEKPLLMAGCAAYVLPSKPRPEFVETFGIALVEKMLAGGGPVITTETGGIGEAVGGTAITIGAGDPMSIRAALDHAVFDLEAADRIALAAAARAHALQFDRVNVFDRLFAPITVPATAG